jgi:hypothetical protein
MMSKKHTVLLTSAVYSNYGIYSPQERIKQTLETAQSARKYIPDALIILVDNSKVDVQNDDSAEFNELMDTVDYYIDNSDDADIQHFHNNVTNYDIGKNAMEVLGLIKALTYIANNDDLLKEVNATSRIFKLSGRYQVTDKFDIKKFDNENTKEKYVFKTRQPSWCDPQVTGVNSLLQTRLYSFTPPMLLDTLRILNTIIQNMFNTFNQNAYIDVEHSMVKFLPADRIVELETVGLMGNIAPNGMMIID